jgi:probable F420-dependent oxidoreductase
MIWFGLSLPVIQQVPAKAAAWEAVAGGPEIAKIARAADRLGYRYVTCSDHVLVAASYAPTMGATWYEPAATLGFVAGATEKVELLTHVVVLPYRHPLITAKTYATLDRLSGGRVILGVGSGHAKPEFRTLGAPYERRGRYTDEAISALRTVWKDEVATFDGELVKFRDVIVAPRPTRPGGPPIWIGGNSRASLARAARLGDGWIPWQLTATDFAAAVASGTALRTELGRTGEFEWIAPLVVAPSASAPALRSQIREWTNAGATGFHVGFESGTVVEFLDRMEWFRREVCE